MIYGQRTNIKQWRQQQHFFTEVVRMQRVGVGVGVGRRRREERRGETVSCLGYRS